MGLDGVSINSYRMNPGLVPGKRVISLRRGVRVEGTLQNLKFVRNNPTDLRSEEIINDGCTTSYRTQDLVLLLKFKKNRIPAHRSVLVKDSECVFMSPYPNT